MILKRTNISYYIVSIILADVVNDISFLPLKQSFTIKAIVDLFLYICDSHNITVNKIILFNVIEFII